MKVYTSYFYQIRRFPSSLLPVSTAMYDPKWYHLSEYHLPLPDKRGVFLGYNATQLHLPKSWYDKLTAEGHSCQGKNCPDLKYLPCPFMQTYASYLEIVNYDKLMSQIKDWLQYTGCTDICFIVHESALCPCAERPVLQAWLKKHGCEVEEWNYLKHLPPSETE